jgi:hypothetical protein
MQLLPHPSRSCSDGSQRQAVFVKKLAQQLRIDRVGRRRKNFDCVESQ